MLQLQAEKGWNKPDIMFSLRKHAHATYGCVFSCKNRNIHQKDVDVFIVFAQNIDCGYTIEPPRRGGSNKYQQSMFWIENKKSRYTLATPAFLYKSGVKGVTHFTEMFS